MTNKKPIENAISILIQAIRIQSLLDEDPTRQDMEPEHELLGRMLWEAVPAPAPTDVPSPATPKEIVDFVMATVMNPGVTELVGGLVTSFLRLAARHDAGVDISAAEVLQELALDAQAKSAE